MERGERDLDEEIPLHGVRIHAEHWVTSWGDGGGAWKEVGKVWGTESWEKLILLVQQNEGGRHQNRSTKAEPPVS